MRCFICQQLSAFRNQLHIHNSSVHQRKRCEERQAGNVPLHLNMMTNSPGCLSVQNVKIHLELSIYTISHCNMGILLLQHYSQMCLECCTCECVTVYSDFQELKLVKVTERLWSCKFNQTHQIIFLWTNPLGVKTCLEFPCSPNHLLLTHTQFVNALFHSLKNTTLHISV